MGKNQLFKIIPDKLFVLSIIKLYGINDFNDNHFFTKKNIEELKTIDKLNELKIDFQKYYLPCKFKIYFDNITIKRSIVILRQLLKLYNHTLLSKEKNKKGIKLSIYQIIPLNKEIDIPKTPKKIKISFE